MDTSVNILNTVFIIMFCAVLLWGERVISKASKHD